MNASIPRILIIIVTWNKQDYVLELLHSVKKLDYDIGNIDLLVIDNASEDDTVQHIQKAFPEVTLICNEENIGGTGGFNTGLKYGLEQPEDKYQYFWLLDNDVVVHPKTLSALVEQLEKEPDVAVIGSTMMQLDYPYRINEMGAFIDKCQGQLIFNRHYENIPAWQGKTIEQLLSSEVDLSQRLDACQPTMDVEYVAAASLLVRTKVVHEVGIWDDFFIHFDDVEWCLRIAEKGHRIQVSAQSLIWHLSAMAKIPTWILYYDNRNILYLLDKHGVAGLKSAWQWTLKKSLYYCLIGKQGLSELLLKALNDYKNQVKGKADINPQMNYKKIQTIEAILINPKVKRVLIPWRLNLQASNSQSSIVKAMRQRPDLHIDYLIAQGETTFQKQLPHSHIRVISHNRFKRYWTFLWMKRDYDIVMQSDYQVMPLISWLGHQILFINNEGCALVEAPKLKQVKNTLRKIWHMRHQWKK